MEVLVRMYLVAVVVQVTISLGSSLSMRTTALEASEGPHKIVNLLQFLVLVVNLAAGMNCSLTITIYRAQIYSKEQDSILLGQTVRAN